MNQLESAILFATWAHLGQKHTAGTPYILHPLRVMNRVWAKGGSEIQQIIAVLHDVVEDTKVTAQQIHKEFGATVAEAVGVLTRKEGVGYEQYVRRIGESSLRQLAVPVKLADLEDNLSLSISHPLPAERQQKLFARYTWAETHLKGIV